ncbi:hypothetical protein HTZ84_00185 [Haloterrigena sp. SYSU A558-1]|uniref:PRC-barrel domain containing protein n=1 Tax=Haloterrigena gelatinilytica TaxID=2741724 RepID=A0A8J8GQ67_9EURY|nr:hypothetical protein [Haloterrigena gelatinilytica]NUB93348.1 hypothetical protein [Haloterrigena gelatinilytica]NUC70745.1 hypothetical protein [Haloterrigena gelatinilytica]
MTATLTDDEVGKTVVDAEGKELGIVAKVENGRASVDPNPSIAEHLLASLGVEGEDEEDYVVTEDMLDSVGEEIVLRGNL